jgi:hypothetical protein
VAKIRFTELPANKYSTASLAGFRAFYLLKIFFNEFKPCKCTLVKNPEIPERKHP